jgi:hypothetical protein
MGHKENETAASTVDNRSQRRVLRKTRIGGDGNSGKEKVQISIGKRVSKSFRK